MRIMGIDYGDQRIGLALSDESAILCGRAWTLNEWNLDRAVARIAEEARANAVGLLVLGLPKNMDGTEGPRARWSSAVRRSCRSRRWRCWRSSHIFSRSPAPTLTRCAGWTARIP